MAINGYICNNREVWNTSGCSNGLIWKQNKYIQDDLTKDISNRFSRLEGIIIKLIDQQKKIQIEQRGFTRSYQSLVEIITNLLKKEK